MPKMRLILLLVTVSIVGTGCLKSATSICSGRPLIAIDPAMVGKHTLYYDRQGYGKDAKFASQADIEIKDLGTGEYSVDSNASFPSGESIHGKKLAICDINGFTIAQAGPYVLYAKSKSNGLFFSTVAVGDEFIERLRLLREWMPNLYSELNPFYKMVSDTYVEVDMSTTTPDGLKAFIDALDLNTPPTKEWDDASYSYQVK